MLRLRLMVKAGLDSEALSGSWLNLLLVLTDQSPWDAARTDPQSLNIQTGSCRAFCLVVLQSRIMCSGCYQRERDGEYSNRL